jgi:hypothetical protein
MSNCNSTDSQLKFGWARYPCADTGAPAPDRSPEREMPRKIYVALYILAMVAVVVSVDVVFFRKEFWERLMANIGIVLVFAAFYLRFLKHP